MMLAEAQFSNYPLEAIDTYKSALEHDQTSFVAHNNLAYLFMLAGAMDSAKKHAVKAYDLNSSNIGVVDTLAQIYIKEGELGSAVQLYTELGGSEITDEAIKLNYIETLLKNNQTALASRELSRMKFRLPRSFLRIEKIQEEYDFKVNAGS